MLTYICPRPRRGVYRTGLARTFAELSDSLPLIHPSYAVAEEGLYVLTARGIRKKRAGKAESRTADFAGSGKPMPRCGPVPCHLSCASGDVYIAHYARRRHAYAGHADLAHRTRSGIPSVSPVRIRSGDSVAGPPLCAS